MSSQNNPIYTALAPDSFPDVRKPALSRWVSSPVKRIFDAAAVLSFFPLWAPLLILVAIAVRLSSRGPIIFQQRRMGRDCRPFTIYKFRTMRHDPLRNGKDIATLLADEVTPVGHVLRRYKLDELPQLINVLLGHMSLVGPRPKVPTQQLEPLLCHPGITGLATLAFAREEILFSQIPTDELDAFYRNTVLPTKRGLDVEYMRSATLTGDFRILLKTVLGKWGSGEAVIRRAFYFREDES
jgi:lipopolysaccharide/colanic/teichoic acid biosynthesis glycosyltransferase